MLRKLELAIVLALNIFPLAHFAFHRLSGNDPWTLGGWAMYAVPRPRIAVSINREGGSIDACRGEAHDYVRVRRAFGTYADSAALSRCLANQPNASAQAVVRTLHFDARDARFRELVETVLPPRLQPALSPKVGAVVR